MTIPPWLFPTIMIILSLASALIWAASGDWRRTVYWLAAAVLTASVTY